MAAINTDRTDRKKSENERGLRGENPEIDIGSNSRRMRQQEKKIQEISPRSNSRDPAPNGRGSAGRRGLRPLTDRQAVYAQIILSKKF